MVTERQAHIQLKNRSAEESQRLVLAVHQMAIDFSAMPQFVCQASYLQRILLAARLFSKSGAHSHYDGWRTVARRFLVSDFPFLGISSHAVVCSIAIQEKVFNYF